MDNQKIQELLDSDALLERFMEVLMEEINSDDEPYYKKARQLLLASLNNSTADDFFIALCGWSLDSLMEKVESFEY
jgi:hypothetical protein